MLVVVAFVVATFVRASSVHIGTVMFQSELATTKFSYPQSFHWPAVGEATVAAPGFGVLGTSGTQRPVSIASVAKVMTAYVVLQDHPLATGATGPTITITAAQAGAVAAEQEAGDSVVAVVPGEQLTEYQALEALLLPSADNIADVLATFDAGSSAAFVAKMTAAASSLDMTHTTYTDPSGLAAGTVSTSSDQVKLAEAAMASPAFAAIVALKSAVLPVAGKITNYNSLLGTDGFVGIKTGSTNAAGGCFMFAVKDTIAGTPFTFYGAVLGQTGGAYIAAGLNAGRALADSVSTAVVERTLVPAGKVVAVAEADGEHLQATASSTLSALVPDGASVTIRFEPEADQPVAQGRRVGWLVSSADPVNRVAVITPEPPKPSLSYRLRHAW